MGDQSYESSRALGVALAKLIEGKDKDTLIVASSDLSHYHAYDEAVKIDHKTLNALRAWDYFSMSRNFEARVWEACGGAPIVAAMIAAERMGAVVFGEKRPQALTPETSLPPGSPARPGGLAPGLPPH